MKKKISIILVILTGCLLTLSIYQRNKEEVFEEDYSYPEIIIPVSEKVEVNYEEYINNLRSAYNNQDIVAVIQIPNVLEDVVVQTTNNDYYLTHTVNHEERSVGATFLDYRTNLTDSKKRLIYSHSDQWDQLPFTKLKNYNQKEFMDNNPYIYIIDSEGKHTYEVFSSYIETKDFDYLNIDNFNGLTYEQHLEKLRKKSFVLKQIELTEDTKVLVLQTCSFDTRVSNSKKYQIVVAKEIEETTN